MKFFANKELASSIVHIVGIGGIGMSGIAEIMHNLGYKVRGSDLTINLNTKRLQSLGIEVMHGHSANNINGAEVIVISPAVKQNNPEYQAAVLAKIPIVSRAEVLAELMRSKIAVAVSGSHGKTTTTALIACLFEAYRLYPTVITGGIMNNKATNAYLGNSDYFIAEADESDATLTKIPATIAVITNIDTDHLDFYKNFDNLVNTFYQFITNLPYNGFAVACIDDFTVQNLINKMTSRKIITYGINSENAHIQAFNIRTEYDYSIYNVKVKVPNFYNEILQITLPSLGEHNVLNSLAAIAVIVGLNFDLKVVKNGFKNFKGIARRFMKTGEYNNITIIDDYAHHPAEVIATVNTARCLADKKQGRVIAIFQPHRYSRLKYLFSDFIHCFQCVDQLYISQVYSAGEQETYNLSHVSLVKAIKVHYQNAYVTAINDLNELLEIIYSQAKPYDIVLLMGAGDITQFAAILPQQLLSMQCIYNAITTKS
ncbi:UDP-N-acetylmuramate--alanine ligase [Orientia chuto str. Dubai]|uniref:UDP-N-acetylmuramate--L-alanine ligase n=1 Tax=Orientia chuto str. Dubai TaxID=1359168 RepID=A0A0F3MLL9_9RICK|nr:UDP-N-acetylmuramate--L-alanine ligase [Candidatus Orientia mediorientalis]KJV56546.1 UDP-N-acetylmuramate--alanine ligase [Orientia chuto str. Dubai]